MAARKQLPSQRKRLTDEEIDAFGQIFPGFAEWYRANHNAEGRYIRKKLPGLKPVEAADQSEPDEEREWDDIVSKPRVRGALRRMAGEVREQALNGETEEGGFALEEKLDG